MRDDQKTKQTALARHLVHFLAVAETGHMTDAATMLGVPQSTLSRSMARLEEDLGMRLLSRDRRGTDLTRAGRELLPYAQRALRELSLGIEESAAALGETTGIVSLATISPTMGRRMVFQLVGGFREEHPGVRFRFWQEPNETVLAMVRSAEADLGITSARPDDSALTGRLLDTDPLCVYLGRGHRLAGRETVGLAALADEEFIGLDRRFGTTELTLRLCERAGFTPRVAHVGESPQTLLALVEAGLGVAVMPAWSREADVDVAVLGIEDPGAELPIWAVYRAGGYESPAVRRFRTHVLRNWPPRLAR
ncbi:LysR family transcriptional regulator [Streptomyces celluloflavus]|uniref:LysR family transcriptional regulator n=1 Tax=Streptomyces celluloflavus TaxID=58344 RepID=UPI0036C121BF